MRETIWRTSAGGLLRAAGVLQQRCGVPMPRIAEKMPEAGSCLDAAEALVGRGKAPGMGLQALAPAFSHLEGRPLAASIRCPWDAAQGNWEGACPNGTFGAGLVPEKLREMAAGLSGQLEKALADRDFAALESACENVLAFLPLYPGDAEDGDVSLYEYGRLTAALASCYAQLAPQAAEPDCGHLQAQPCLLLFSCDFSGIQNFIYLISTKSALKMLRSRSFYLELMMEHLLDELLDACGLAHCNCLYAGGGHAYALLPRTEQAEQAAEAFSASANRWLREQFGISLYLACGVQPCSPADLFGLNGQQAYGNVFRGLSARLGHAKLTRCDAAALKALNHSLQDARECRICGRPAEKDGLCGWCDRFARLGGRLTEPNRVFAIAKEPLALSKLCLPMPGIAESRYACLLSAEQAKSLAGVPQVLRWYSKNGAVPLSGCRRLWMGDHCPTPLLEELSRQAEGIVRMGVFRADVDNLGKAFISGFASPDGKRNRVSLVRTMAFSRCISIFFKRYINQILKPFEGVLVVYSGGDDLFLVGGWSELLQAARCLRQAFARFTGGALTFSGGFGLYTDHYPVARAAQETAGLEDFAKESPGKDAITLFAAMPDLRFTWQVFGAAVMDEKYRLLDSFFGNDENGRGNSFLYQLLEYLRAAGDRLNLARCAYLLARLRPGRSSSAAQKSTYETYAHNFYTWALQPEDRRQLVAAIYLYVYLNRSQNAE